MSTADQVQDEQVQDKHAQEKTAQIRARILDAATGCLLDGGFATSRLHSAIAERARLSRPTLYKYVGDQEAIMAALLQRELAAFLDLLQPMLARTDPLRANAIDVIAFVVDYARGHPLLQAAMREVPEQVLPWFTTHAAVLIDQVRVAVEPALRRRIDNGELPPADGTVIIDWLCRIAISLVFTTGPTDIRRPDDLRRFIGALLDLPALAHGSTAPLT